MDQKYAAVPYALHARPFTFSSLDEFEAKYKAHFPVEEYQIEVVDLDDDDLITIFNQSHTMLGANGMRNLSDWFEFVSWWEDACEYSRAAVYWLITTALYSFQDAIDKLDDAIVFEGTLRDYAYHALEEGYVNEDLLPSYFDFEQFGRDLRMDFDEEDEERFAGMTDRQVGEEYVFEVLGGVEELDSRTLTSYFDPDQLARDLQLGGEADEFEFNGQTWVMTTAALV